MDRKGSREEGNMFNQSSIDEQSDLNNLTGINQLFPLGERNHTKKKADMYAKIYKNVQHQQKQ